MLTQLGYVTAILPELSLEDYFAFAAKTGLDSLEIKACLDFPTLAKTQLFLI